MAYIMKLGEHAVMEENKWLKSTTLTPILCFHPPHTQHSAETRWGKGSYLQLEKILFSAESLSLKKS